jgi:hypothetical protein
MAGSQSDGGPGPHRSVPAGRQQLGHIDGRNVRIEYRASEGDADAIRKYATDLVALAPDVILATGVSMELLDTNGTLRVPMPNIFFLRLAIGEP